MMRRRWLLPAFVAVAFACGDDGPSAPDVREVTITTAGGTVTSADGKVTLVIPANALAEPTGITIRPAPATTDARLVPGSEYIFEPDGLQFALPARLTIRFDSIPATLAERADYLWLHRRNGSGWAASTGEPLNRAVPSVAGWIDGFSSYGGVVSQLAADLLLAAQQLDAMLTDAIPQHAIALIQTIVGLLARELDPDFPLAEIVITTIQSTACNAYASAVGNARDAPVNDWAVFTALLEPVYSWSAVAAKAGALDGCPNAPLTLEQIQNLKIQQFVDFYLGRLDPSSFAQNFDELLDEVQFVVQLRGNVQLLGLPAADHGLESGAQHPLMRELRVSAYAACRSNGEHEYLGRLRDIVQLGDYTDDDLLTDLQQCATRLMWQVRSQDQQVDEDGDLGGGAVPGSEVVEAMSTGVAKGTFTLSGDVRAFRCPDGSFGGDELIVTLDGVEVHRRQATGGAFFASPLMLDAETVLATAGVDPGQTSTVPLVAARESQGCGQYVQVIEPIPLATLRLGYPPPFRYFNDFSGVAGPEWSSQIVSTSPSGESFLGGFSGSAVTLQLTQLPAHTQVMIEFDLYIIDSWNGDDDDTFTFVAGGQTLKHTSFANHDDEEQAFPGDLPGASNPAYTGAAGINVLGYGGNLAKAGDSVYRLSFALTHSASTILLSFSSSVTGSNEQFGIDNMRVTVQ